MTVEHQDKPESRGQELWHRLRQAWRGPLSAPSTGELPPRETLEAELLVAAFRTLVILAVVTGPRLLGLPDNYDSRPIWLAFIAGIYNIVTALASLYPHRLRLRAPFTVIMDGLLITAWMKITLHWDLFPFYYVVVVLAALWYQMLGGLVAAAFCNFLFLYIWAQSASDPDITQAPIFTAGMVVNCLLLGVVGALVGFVTEARQRDRLERQEDQLLIENYQREIDIAGQLQPLLVSPRLMNGATHPGSTGKAPAVSNGETAQHGYTTLPGGMELAVAMQTARRVGGGDFFEIIPLEDGRTALCIADVSGKSVRAQARLPLLKYALRACASQHRQPDQLVATLNKLLAPDLFPELFIALCYVIVDVAQGQLIWCNAGHSAPLLIRAAAHEPTAESTPLAVTGPALGMFENSTFTCASATWQAGDRLLLFTDGLSDAFSYDASEDGEAQVCRLSTGMAARQQPARELVQQLLQLANTALHESSGDGSASQHPRWWQQRASSTEPAAPRSHRDDISLACLHFPAEKQAEVTP